MKDLKIIKHDPWLEPFKGAIEGRHNDVINKERELTQACGSLTEFANAHEYFGLHRTQRGGWVFREWAPGATAITLVGDFSNWKPMKKFELRRLPGSDGVWETRLRPSDIHHGQHYKMIVEWPGGSGERIPAYARRVVQDENTKLFSAQVWAPEHPYEWKSRSSSPTRAR